MSKYKELKKKLLEDGIIDAEEVQLLRTEIYADGIVDREEAEFVFELNDATSGANNDPTWSAFFVEVLTDFLLKDMKSPGEIDDDEAVWLIAHIEKDGEYDDNEKALVANIKAKAKKISPKLTI